MIPGGATQLLKPSTRDRFLDCELGPKRKLSLEVGSSPQKKRFQRIFGGLKQKKTAFLLQLGMWQTGKPTKNEPFCTI